MKKKIGISALGFILILFIIWFYYHNFTFNRYIKLSETEAANIFKSSMSDSIPANLKFLTLVKDEQTAIEIAEPILFNLYGKKNILMQRPYQICLTGKNWLIIGTFPRIATLLGASGGTFEIIINSANAEVISITHGK